MNLEVARKAFIRIRDVRYVELVNKTEAGKKQVRDWIEAVLTAESFVIFTLSFPCPSF